AWQSKAKKGKYEYTSLRGADRKKLLQRLPSEICGIIPGSNGIKITELWKALTWINKFTDIPLDGHKRQNVTPYIHMMAYHVPYQMKLHGGIKRFTSQGVEKNSDMARKSYFSSNHKNAPKEVILTASRLEKLSTFKRQKRPYNKHNEEYWDS
uniref:Uncharacterized protein n=1 Tax=Amphimedon queenslandica TaxID=400682 RepID=A0A1X7V662_AMPQE